MAYATSCPICGESDDEYNARISDPFGDDCELGVAAYVLIVEALLHCLCFEMWLFTLFIKSGMDDDELDEAAAAAAVEKKDC